MSSLTEKMILARSRAKALADVTKLNLWGARLSDVSVLQNVPNLQVLTLSSNNVTSLRHLTSCLYLKELYIRKNGITSLDELNNLRGNLCLRVLWMADNPCTQDEHYRLKVIACLPQLQRLDNVDIEDEERKEAATALASGLLGSQPQTASIRTATSSIMPTSPMTGNRVLTAVMCLLQELDVNSLQTITQAAQDQLNCTTATMAQSGSAEKTVNEKSRATLQTEMA